MDTYRAGGCKMH